MIQIYHNPRCSKSRSGLKYLEEKGIQPEVIQYLDTPLSSKDLTQILQKLNMRPLEIIRKGEAIFKEEFKGKDLSDEQWIEAMVQHPRLIERPIIINGNRAVIARPTEAIDEIL